MHKTASRDNLIDRTIRIRLANNLSPSNESLDEHTVVDVQLGKILLKNLALSRSRRILLLNSHSETLEECLVEDIRTDESTIVAALALGVCSSKHRKASGRMHNLTSLLVEVWLALKNRLQAEDVLGAKVALIKKKHSTTTHRSQHRTFAANGATVNQLIRTNEVGLIGALGDIHANQLTLERSTHLLNHHGLAVTRKTSDVDRVEDSRTDNVLEVAVESERNIGAILFWHK